MTFDGVETLRSFVNTWECDENDHLNVQFYFDRFSDADDHFRHMAGLDGARLGPRITRHVRYQAELFNRNLIAVRSALVRGGPFPVTVAHIMVEPASGRLAATMLDGYRPEDGAAAVEGAGPRIDADPAFLPRSLPAEPAEPASPEEAMAGSGVVTMRSGIHKRHCDGQSRIRDSAIIGFCSDAAAHIWAHGGVKADWLEAHNFGHVAVEMKLTRLARPVSAGDLVHFISQFKTVRDKTFSFRHTIYETRSGDPFAIVEVTALLMDLETRRAAAAPGWLKDNLMDRGAVPEG